MIGDSNWHYFNTSLEQSVTKSYIRDFYKTKKNILVAAGRTQNDVVIRFSFEEFVFTLK